MSSIMRLMITMFRNTKKEPPEINKAFINIKTALANKLIDEAGIIQRELLSQLETKYSRELSSKHTAGIFDPHKARHAQKVDLAHRLKKQCKLTLSSIGDAE